MRNIYIVMMVCLVCVSKCHAEGLNTLVELGKAQAEIQKSYKEETAVYNGVKKAINSGAIKKGQTGREIESKYGQPVVTVNEYGTDRDKWIYKPAKSSFFEGEKICLFFSRNGILEEVSKSE